MTTLTLPDPIAAYFAADKQNAEALAQCFTARATVTDEGHSHVGRDAIRAWKAAASAKYTYTNEPLALEQTDGCHIVTSRVAGNFPGSPVDLRYYFRLERGLIASLEIVV
ncbi:nuclear transport factor 2 family protein [Enhygromyxa salina]|uniref:SnoaL-like domain protein n=1 Tax=Enhygromyxa salina TaxID=215803 RepID=A0A2S9XTW8_9BACT|nr:nuclear transport factor 2 family protein [Enhygromyxa salina]PRP96319.1 SnoaL-like domain protein [Enhygromyxa salina]